MTAKPRSCMATAALAMAVPPMPTKWTLRIGLSMWSKGGRAGAQGNRKGGDLVSMGMTLRVRRGRPDPVPDGEAMSSSPWGIAFVGHEDVAAPIDAGLAWRKRVRFRGGETLP